MTPLISKRHPLKFYATLLFVTLFLSALGTLFLNISLDALQKENPEIKEYFLPVFGFVFYLLAFFMLYTYWKNSPKIILDKHLIKIGNETFYLKDIKDIALTGKMPFKYIFNYPMEGTAILFTNRIEKILFDDMYSNSSEIKLFLEQVVLEKKDFTPNSTQQIRKDSIRFENEEPFKGNQFTSLRGITLWGTFAIITFVIISKPINLSLKPLIFLSAFGTFWFVMHSWLMHYFGLTKEYLIVRNHNFIWMTKIFRLTDIKEVVFETQGKLPNCMRIITKDYRNKLFPAGTLSNKTWLEMKKKLKSKGVTVRNECIY